MIPHSIGSRISSVLPGDDTTITFKPGTTLENVAVSRIVVNIPSFSLTCLQMSERNTHGTVCRWIVDDQIPCDRIIGTILKVDRCFRLPCGVWRSAGSKHVCERHRSAKLSMVLDKPFSYRSSVHSSHVEHFLLSCVPRCCTSSRGFAGCG